jgi:hypothetical protein
MTSETRAASVEELETGFQRELGTNRWAAAETAYVLAVRHRDDGNWEQSREWVQQCLRLLEGFLSFSVFRAPPPPPPPPPRTSANS